MVGIEKHGNYIRQVLLILQDLLRAYRTVCCHIETILPRKLNETAIW